MKTPPREKQPRMFLSPSEITPTHHTIRHFIEAMRRHDPALIDHGKRTALYSLALGRALNLSEDDLSNLCHASLLHDLGKLTLPNEVIQHNGVSMIGDYLMTECSPQAGANMLRPWPALQNIATLIALHHERWDGTGQPFGMRGRLIPLGARILSLTDTVDQLLTQKTDSFSAQATTLVRILRTLSGTRFDPTLVELFVEWFQDIFLETFVGYPWMEECDESFPSPTLTYFDLLQGSPLAICHPQPLDSPRSPYIDQHVLRIIELTSPVKFQSSSAYNC